MLARCVSNLPRLTMLQLASCDLTPALFDHQLSTLTDAFQRTLILTPLTLGTIVGRLYDTVFSSCCSVVWELDSYLANLDSVPAVSHVKSLVTLWMGHGQNCADALMICILAFWLQTNKPVSVSVSLGNVRFHVDISKHLRILKGIILRTCASELMTVWCYRNETINYVQVSSGSFWKWVVLPPSSEKMGNTTPYANKKWVACRDNKTVLNNHEIHTTRM